MAHPDKRHISFTYTPVTSMWVVALHSLFLYSALSLPCHSPSIWLRLFLKQNFSHIYILQPHSFFTPTCLWRWNRQCSEMLAYKIQMLRNYRKGSIQHSEHSESFQIKNMFSMLAYVYYLTKYLSFQVALYNTLLAELHTSLLDLQRGINFLSLCHLS
jgi:hypothetical protein